MESSETSTEKIIEERKGKIINWIKKNYLLLGILIFAFAVRLYFFILIKNQPLWWDEAAYGSLAKGLIHPFLRGMEVVYSEWLIRPPLLPIIWAALLKLGFPELGIRFLVEFAPSILTVFFVYLAGKELYDKEVGLISAAIFSVLWIHVFYTVRFLTDIPALPFLFLSIYYFAKSDKQEFNIKYLSLSLFLLGIATLIRFQVGIIFFAYLIVFLFSHRFSLLRNPKFYSYALIGVVPIIIFFIINFMVFGNIFPALLGGSYLRSPGEKLQGIKNPFHFQTLNFIPAYLQTIFFIFFIFGLLIIAFELSIGYNLLPRNKRLRSHLLLVLSMLLINAFFIFYLRAAEDRWLFPTSLTMVCFSSLGVLFLYNYVKKYSKYIALIVVLGILLFGAYYQLTFADNLIEDKKTSFLQIREGFEWIKENTEQNSVISGSGIEVYSVYYSERNYLPLPENKSDISKVENSADYLVVHAFTPQAGYINDYLRENQDRWQPLNVFFFDIQKQNPALVIYKNMKKS